MTEGVTPSGSAPSTEPGVKPPSSCRLAGAGPVVGSVHANVTAVPDLPMMRKCEGGCGVVMAATAIDTVATLPGPVLLVAQ